MTVYRLGLFPVTEAVLDQIPLQGLDPSSVDLFIVQHLLDDTSAFLGLLQRKGYCIRSVLGVEYSSRADVTASLLSAGIDVLVPPLAELEGVASNQLARALEPGSGGKPVIVHEVGGWCAPFLHNAGSRAKSRLVGVVEETKRGLWRYQGLGDLDFRVVQIADSELKKIEAGLVGDAVARVIEADCLELGECLPGTPVGVLGFGDIGSAVASSLAARRCLVSCYDPNPIRAIEARMRGLARAGRDEILGRARIIVGASGAASLKFADLHRTPDGVLLYSASSRDVEFPVGEIVSSAHSRKLLSNSIEEFTLDTGRRVRVASSGRPVNFRTRSLPVAFADLLFSQIAAGFKVLLSNTLLPGLNRLPDDYAWEIARLWLDQHR